MVSFVCVILVLVVALIGLPDAQGFLHMARRLAPTHSVDSGLQMALAKHGENFKYISVIKGRNNQVSGISISFIFFCTLSRKLTLLDNQCEAVLKVLSVHSVTKCSPPRLAFP